MENDSTINAEIYINNFKNDVNIIYEKYYIKTIEDLCYAKKAYAIMQQEEIKTALKMLDALKTQINWLSDSCIDISDDNDENI